MNAILKQRSDIVVMGSSRALHQFVPKTISRETGLSVFNAGVDGQTLLFYYGLEQLILERYSPKVIILNLDPRDVVNAKNAYEKLSALLPYYRNREIYDMLRNRSYFEPLKLLSRIYPYNSTVVLIAGYNLMPHHRAYENGYEPIYGSQMEKMLALAKIGQINEAQVNIASEWNKADDALFEDALKKFCASALLRGIKVVICYSPYWARDGLGTDITSEEIRASYRNIIARNRIPFIEITQDTDSAFSDPKLFNDLYHLNSDGAELFSIKFGRHLKEYVQ